MRKFPFIQQHDSMQCGSTCLQMILKYYGKNFTSDYLNDLCGVSKDGVSLLGISGVANQLGMHSICGRVTLEKLSKEAPLPCIIHWNQNHFVVLYKVKGNKTGERKYDIADPGNGLFIF
ncbi:C39 family peptidase [Dysgonomonas sp. GY75]|uniref:cysteine peptidase family C39 domain-containing protein n=1 Tax=Dysgonomonas sp. GY75 TaxID=2780419 RepID=UPI0018834DC6|nr:cysteine peptidase family C39 domain-containing protein [Dysgonomonas sp. GY75]MBF0651530.1 C39 family peptidase [Dysgonomonas sp. GY75]